MSQNMPPDFRYRYVDFGTVFVGDPRSRETDDSAESPGTLFANELATDVGGTCWGANEPLPVIDHHFPHDGQFPCATAAVLHKAPLIRQRFGNRSGALWLVTHHEPDFDALCSMYLARWIVEDPTAGTNCEDAGLHPEGWVDLPARQRINWISPDLSAVPPEHRWAFLLASYASVLETRHRVSCPRERALRSILYAALKRGRDYLNATSGATEFFDEVRLVIQQQQLNPVFDSVLEGSATFGPELAMLDREAEAYQRDMLRARRSTVYLPESEAPTPDFFKHPKQLGFHDQRSAAEVDAEHLLLADTFRIPTDGIFLRDPECLLFTDWARLDLENSALGAGFEFTAIAASNGRSQSVANKSDYCFSIDPERANGRHLYTVWSRLQTEEVEALKTHQREVMATPSGASLRGGAGQKTTTLDSLLADPWLGGQNRFGTAVGTPHRGTLIGPPGVRSDLRDDPVSEAVRTELEGSIYSAASLVAGPQVTVFDFAGSKEGVDIEPRQYNLNAPLDIPASPETYFRFANIRLRADVPITNPNLTLQIGETLWQVLYPEMPGSTPTDFAERHLFISAGSVGVWGDRGIAIAQKPDFAAGASAPDRQAAELRDDFAALVSLARDVDRLTADWNQLSNYSPAGADSASLPERQIDLRGLQAIASNGEELARRAAQVKHALTLPDRDLFRRFYEAINVDQLLETLRDLTHAAGEHLRRHQLAEQAKQMESRSDAVARVQSKLEWLEVFIIGFFAVGIIDVITRHVNLGNDAENALVLLGGPLFIGLTAWILKPWRKKKKSPEGKIDRPVWILIAVAGACVIAWLAGLAHLWKK
jgi:hypothetical protein